MDLKTLKQRGEFEWELPATAAQFDLLSAISGPSRYSSKAAVRRCETDRVSAIL